MKTEILRQNKKDATGFFGVFILLRDSNRSPFLISFLYYWSSVRPTWGKHWLLFSIFLFSCFLPIDELTMCRLPSRPSLWREEKKEKEKKKGNKQVGRRPEGRLKPVTRRVTGTEKTPKWSSSCKIPTRQRMREKRRTRKREREREREKKRIRSLISNQLFYFPEVDHIFHLFSFLCVLPSSLLCRQEFDVEYHKNSHTGFWSTQLHIRHCTATSFDSKMESPQLGVIEMSMQNSFRVVGRSSEFKPSSGSQTTSGIRTRTLEHDIKLNSSSFLYMRARVCAGGGRYFTTGK